MLRIHKSFIFPKLAIFFCISHSCLTAAPSPPRPNILVINSYNHGYAWSDDILRGLASSLESNGIRPEIWVEYMDTKRFGGDEYLARFRSFVTAKYQGRQFDVIVTSDDDALEFLMKNSELPLFASAPVVFCGINEWNSAGKVPRDRFTGMLEDFQMGSILNLALGFHPGVRQVWVITDKSAIGNEQFRAYSDIATHRTAIRFRFLKGDDLSLGEITTAVRGIAPEDLVILGSFAHDRTEDYFDWDDAHRQIVAASAAPVYSPSISNLGQGIVGANENEGYLHGVFTANKVLQILRGVSPAKIPIEKHRVTQYVFDLHQLRKFGIDAKRLPPGSHVINNTENFYQQHWRFIWLVAAAVLLQSVIIVLLWRNIEQRKLAERERSNTELALIRSEEKLHRLVEADVVGVFISSGEWIVGGNDYFLDMVQRERVELREHGLSWRSVVPEDQVEIRGFLTNGGDTACHARETRLIRNDGGEVPVLFGAVGTGSEGKPGTLGFVVDLTQRKSMEEQFAQSQRLESLGQLAGGVAHDFNNLLTVIIGYSRLGIEEAPQGSSMRRKLEQIAKAAESAANMTSHLLTFSKRKPGQPGLFRLNDEIRSMELMLRRLIGEDIGVSVSLSEDSGYIYAGPGQIEQLLINLAINARDAMPAGGRIRIETNRRVVSSTELTAPMSLPPGAYAEIIVSDTGTGMTPEVQARIFEPFFTTKGLGKGTGLGLSTVYGIVTQHGGSISVESPPGKGTSFRILFPSVATPGEAESVGSAAPIQPGSGTILLVEDDESLRQYAREVLDANGYITLETVSAMDAVSIAINYAGTIDVLLTDIVMPEISGIEVASEVKRHRPGVAVLYMSGYPDRFTDIESTGVAYLRKPFSAEALLRQVQAATCRDRLSTGKTV